MNLLHTIQFNIFCTIVENYSISLPEYKKKNNYIIMELSVKNLKLKETIESNFEFIFLVIKKTVQ